MTAAIHTLAKYDTPKQARLLVIIAAILWSTSSIFTRLLREPTALHLDVPLLDPLLVAGYRGLFAGMVLFPLLRITDFAFSQRMIGMIACFGLMSGLYLSALSLGPAANAILLQNTAPFWVYIFGLFILSESPDSKTARAIIVAMLGALVIVIGNWPQNLDQNETHYQGMILLMAVGSGVTYAFVILLLRSLRQYSSTWLTVMNMFGSAGLIISFILLRNGFEDGWVQLKSPTFKQMMFIAIFGVLQMALPYYLFTRGLRTISPQEAALITLLEPILNPIWAYLLSPDKETPTSWTWVGGLILIGSLIWRYLPRHQPRVTSDSSS